MVNGPVTSKRPNTRSRQKAEPLDLEDVEKRYKPSPLQLTKKSRRVFGLTEAPVFYPTHEEFIEPLKYIQKIAPIGKQHGIAKIVPPHGWRPPFAIDTERFFFRSRKQELNQMDCVFRANTNYLEQLYKFHHQQGTDLSSIPNVNGKSIDFYKLRRLVEDRGGFTKVNDKRRWNEIAIEFGLTGKLVQPTSVILRQAYQKIILPYELYAAKAKTNIAMQQSPAKSPSKSSGMRQRQTSENISRFGENMTGINGSTRARSRSESVSQEIQSNNGNGETDGKTTPLSSEALQEPFTEEREAKRARYDSGSSHASNTSSNGKQPKHAPGDVCEICGRGDKSKFIILCDECDRGFHTFCLDPPLSKVPTKNWYCDRCIVGTGEFGFQDGGIYSLKQFQQKADAFKAKYFSGWEKSEDGRVQETEVEREYWRLIESKTTSVEVEYGADIHSTVHGSAFPTLEKNPSDPYSIDPWNLNVMPICQDSVLRHIKTDISGMTVPWVYVGMCFSTFCWHNEDHHTYSINYQHLGDTKTWYGVPGDHAGLLESTMKNGVPDLFEQQPDLLFQLVTMLSPERLAHEGVKVVAVDQRPNEFIVTFPKAYHSGFNHGFNVNEAVNFATSDWASEGYSSGSVKLYQEFSRPPVFSHDELVVTTALQDPSIETSIWLSALLKEVVNREISERSLALKRHPEARVELKEEDLPEQEYQCSACKTFTYLSQVTNESSDFTFCCKHSDQVPADATSLILRLRYSDRTLSSISESVTNKSTLPDAWKEKLRTVMSENERPPVKTLRALLSEGEKIHYEMQERNDLRQFVYRVTEWIEEANAVIARKHVSRRKNDNVWRKGAKVREEQGNVNRYRDPDYIKFLLVSAESLPFDSPEIQSLQEKYREIQLYLAEAQEALNKSDWTKSEWVEFLTRGKALNVDLPELSVFERHISQLDWVDQFNDSYRRETSLSEVMEIVEKGLSCGIPYDNGYMRRLTMRRDSGIQWEKAISRLLTMEPLPVQQLMIFLNQAKSIPLEAETYAKLNNIITRMREMTEAIEDVVTRANESVFDSRPTMEVARALMAQVEQMPSKSDIAIKFTKMFNRVSDWIRRGKRLFGKANAPFEILIQHLEYVDNRNKQCFSLSDRPRGPIEPSSRENSPEAMLTTSADGTLRSTHDLFCLCRQPENGMMVECEICHEWYHGKCLKLSKKKIASDERFTCPICDWRAKIPRPSNRPRLEDLVALLSDVTSLPFIPTEFGRLNSVVSTGQAYREQLRPLVENPLGITDAEVPLMRFHLRKLEGAEILLAAETNTFRTKLHYCVPVAPMPPPIIDESKSTRKPRMKKAMQEEPNKPEEQGMQMSHLHGSAFYNNTTAMPFLGSQHPPPQGTYDPNSVGFNTTIEGGQFQDTGMALYPRASEQIAQHPFPHEHMLYCICQQPYYPDVHFEMIHCEACQNWFHYDCVGLTADIVERLQSYLCPDCSARQGEAYPFEVKRPGVPQTKSEQYSNVGQYSSGPLTHANSMADLSHAPHHDGTSEAKTQPDMVNEVTRDDTQPPSPEPKDIMSVDTGGMEFVNM